MSSQTGLDQGGGNFALGIGSRVVTTRKMETREVPGFDNANFVWEQAASFFVLTP